MQSLNTISSKTSQGVNNASQSLRSNQTYGRSYRTKPGSETNSIEFQKRQLTAMRKATDEVECPPKEKHVRFILLGCAHEKKASTFWWSARQLPLSSQPVTAWKFFYCLHRLIKESGSAAGINKNQNKRLSPILQDCLKHNGHMKQIGDLWKGMLHLPYASLIAEYSQLIHKRLEFHKRYLEDMPGGELEFTGEHLKDDVNYLFEVSTETCDQLEQVLSLATLIMSTMSFQHATDATPAGQCRLAACPLLILDSSKLYDYLVKVLFRMHNLLPADVLEGHRHRFIENHKKLKKFYDRCKSTLFIKTRIQIPDIPDNAPDFLATAEFQEQEHTQVAQDVKIIEDDSQSLISIDDILDMRFDSNPEPVAVQPPQNNDNSVLIPQLLEEIDHLKSKLAEQERNNKDEIMTLFQALSVAKKEVEEKNIKIDELQSKVPQTEQLSNQAQNLQKLYQTIRGKYMKLVDDHSKVLSKNQESQRELHRLNALLTQKLDSNVIFNALSLRSQQIVLSAQQDKVILAQEKAESLLVERCQRALENGVAGILTVADENVPELCSMMINLAAQLHSILVISYNHCADESTQLTQAAVSFYNNFAAGGQIATEQWIKNSNISEILNKIMVLAKNVEGNNGNNVEDELAAALKIVEQSMGKMSDMLAMAKVVSDPRLSPEILDLCKELMGLIKLLVIDSKHLQDIIVAAGRQSGLSPAEFYHKNSRWTDGLLSAAKAVGWAAQYLTNCADESLKGTGKIEYLQVSCNETLASTAQLVSASKVKAPQSTDGIQKLQSLTHHSSQISECAGRVLARVKHELENAGGDQLSMPAFDNIMQSRKAELDTNAKVKELENQLSVQRLKLGKVRSEIYQQPSSPETEKPNGTGDCPTVSTTKPQIQPKPVMM